MAAVQSVLIVGTGVMGRGTAYLFAAAGLDVTVHNPRRAECPFELPKGVRYTQTLPAEAPDFVLENVSEKLPLKLEIFAALEAAYGGRTIIATNTSSLPLDEMAATLKHPEKFIGFHFFTPADVTPLIEVIRCSQTEDAVVEATVGLVERAGREPILISRPVPGFLWNRLQHALLHEAFHAIETGLASPGDVDKVMKQLIGPRLSVVGLIEGKDIQNLETTCYSQEQIVPHLHHEPRRCRILDRKLERKQFGISTGQGFYDWTGKDVGAVAANAKAKLERLNAFLDAERAAEDPELAPGPALPID